MASVHFYHSLALILLLWTGAARADDLQHPPQLYGPPVLVIDPGTHTASIKSASADRDGRWAVTGSDDKTVRIWSLADGKLERTIRPPAGPGPVGRIVAVAMSPDGSLIAAGGWTRRTETDRTEQVYLFDRATGTLVKRIEIERPRGTVEQLAFSPDGSRLAALGASGLRVYAGDRGWDEAARDEDYQNRSAGADFAPDGRLATTSFDGKVRLYAPGLAGAVRPVVTVELPGNLFGIAFSPPEGERIAVGYDGTPRVALLEGHSLATLPAPDTTGLQDVVDVGAVGWSRDGATLLAGGMYGARTGGPVFAWGEGGGGPRRRLAETKETVQKLLALPTGDFLEADLAGLSRLGPDGTIRWTQQEQRADFRGQEDHLTVSTDGTRVGFGYEPFGGSATLFDTRTLVLGPGTEARMAAPRQTGLNVEHWRGEPLPTLDGKSLGLTRYERSHSLAIHPSGKSFVLAAEWSLRAYDAEGAPLWSRPTPDVAWAVNITGDGRLVVAAYGDGTIRWHRMADGVELLAFMPLADRSNWVAWTPEGFYAATAGAQGVLRWHVNRGWEPADSVAVEDIPGSYRPELLPLILQDLETPRAFGLAGLAEHSRQVMIRTHSRIAPGAQLHLLTIGIDQYNEEYAKNLRLHFAARDARDLASAIVNTQDALYQVKPTVLLDKDANKTGILRALKNIRAAMETGAGDDLAVIHFSGHGALVDHKLSPAL